MNENSEAPSAWRLLWSPKAMAWWARYRPVISLRIGTAAFGVWWGGFIGWFLAFADEPFAVPTSETLGFGMGVGLVVIFSIHGWTWLPVVNTSPRHRFSVVSAVMLASIPAAIIDTPDAFLSLYRDAVHYAQFDPANPSWPKLPATLLLLTNTCMWTYASLVIWLFALFSATLQLSRLPMLRYENICDACGYDLRGTRAAGIERCPECGAAVEALAGNQTSIS